ncbi:error-prone DNA polymerase [Oceanobacter mangrovi]|uniref:error-prone DNA polymerase n=1 Tax=Oceanobacter mangrovi TaxID=2862510 RepID=UPI001C8F1561|nr:error-prone DNA polymerase [Oceanobacter mangrovi]
MNQDVVTPAAPFAYAELHCISNFSFLRGASHPEELIQRAAELNYHSLAITDECSLAGVVRGWQALKEWQQQHPDNHAPKLIIGAEFRWQQHCFVLLAPSRKAYAELCQLISRCRRAASKGEYRFTPQDLLESAQLLLLWQPAATTDFKSGWIKTLRSHFQHRLWLLAERLLDENDSISFDQLLTTAEQLQLPVTCASQVHMHHPSRQPLQDCLTAIRLGACVADIPAQLFSNAERHLRSHSKLASLYSQPLLASTVEIANRCQFELDEISYQYPDDCVPQGVSATDWLRQQVIQGQQRRFPDGTPTRVQATIDKELALIERKQYEHYFLTIHDIVQFAKNAGILCQGRGSAANSVVCYCLGITEVNPVEVSLLFERFISEERKEPPDIDVDFESQRREEVIQYIYRKYGRERAALAATVISYRPKSAVRDIGKALGLDLMQLEHVIANFGWRYRGPNWIDEFVSPALGQVALLHQFKQRLQEILGFPRHLSQHVGGFVITAGRLTDLVPIENAAMADRTVIQWDKEDLETMGLMKMDVLGLGMLSAIRRALAMLGEQQGRTFSITDIPREDPPTYQMLQKADSVGVFQVESRAQMNMLPRLKPRNYYDLVIEVSIVRPGPIHGDMVHPYLKRRNGEEAADYPLPELKPILERTLGIPLFQEQVIAFAMEIANFSAAEADLLRRSMASWRKKGHMHRLQARLASAMKEKGFTEEYIQRIQRQLEGFGEYGFPESHAASFALLVYITAWLKCHHPAIFCCALLNSQPMGFYSPAQLIEDARHHGVVTLPVDINASQRDHMLEPYQGELAIRLGLRLVRGLSEQAAQQLISARPPQGYKDLSQCRYLSAVDAAELAALASANAFASLQQQRQQASWIVSEALDNDLLAMTANEPEPFQWPLDCPNEVEELLQDYQALGLSLGRHPIEILREQGKLGQAYSAASLKFQAHETELWVAGLVTCRQRPGTSAGVTFVTLEDETGNINVVVWLDLAKRQLQELTQARILQVFGKLEKDDHSGILHIIAYRLNNLSSEMEQLAVSSHDFH